MVMLYSTKGPKAQSAKGKVRGIKSGGPGAGTPRSHQDMLNSPTMSYDNMCEVSSPGKLLRETQRPRCVLGPSHWVPSAWPPSPSIPEERQAGS